MYDSSTGRFTTEDPLLFGGGDTNLQRYVYNNPEMYIDPDGTAKQTPQSVCAENGIPTPNITTIDSLPNLPKGVTPVPVPQGKDTWITPGSPPAVPYPMDNCVGVEFKPKNPAVDPGYAAHEGGNVFELQKVDPEKYEVHITLGNVGAGDERPVTCETLRKVLKQLKGMGFKMDKDVTVYVKSWAKVDPTAKPAHAALDASGNMYQYPR